MDFELTGEQHCAAFTWLYGLETVRLRYFNPYGPRQPLRWPCAVLVLGILKAMLQGQSPVLYGDGSEPYGVVYVDDVVYANLLAAEARRAYESITPTINPAKTRPFIISRPTSPTAGSHRIRDL